MFAAINKIQKYVQDLSFEDFLEDDMRIDAVLRNLEVIGEAAGNIPLEVRNSYPHIQWKKIVGLRNILIHEYFGVDLEIVWDIIESNLENLKSEIGKALEK
ncbi:DUF86 domain-containing protein [Methanolobus sp. ZRKC3]|uniref:HepT-like ribonuclease domain-containing protein n=1 Tax=Methanolobus sp. ZRKC3 TaxID=3125786 RepID=UPI003251F94E